MNNWEEYRRRFETTALAAGHSNKYILHFSGYAKNLFDQGLPIVYDQYHLANLLGYRANYVRKITNSPEHFYRVFSVAKKAGGERLISEPLPSLKEIQRWILDEILRHIPLSGYAKAFREKRSIRDNAYFHVDRNLVLSIDIKDFFNNLRHPKVFGVFLNLGYSTAVANMLTRLCTLKSSLPQGAPTSPALSNILMRRVDSRIAGFTRNKGIFYTRYADDMTFSGDFPPGMIIKFVQKVLHDENLEINQNKTRTRRPGQQQKVTGIIVNKKMQAPRSTRRELRQKMYYINKYGFDSHLRQTENSKANHIRHLLGVANFILSVNPKDLEVQGYYEQLIALLEDQI
jgi:RNA-directed DNA polymerase